MYPKRNGKEWNFSASGETFNTYSDCVRVQGAGRDFEFQAWAEGFVGQTTYDTISDWIKFFEDEYDCAGICEPSYFYWSKSVVTSGKPSSSCISSIKDNVTSAFMGLGIATLVAGIFLMFVFVMQYCLWRKYSDF